MARGAAAVVTGSRAATTKADVGVDVLARAQALDVAAEVGGLAEEGAAAADALAVGAVAVAAVGQLPDVAAEVEQAGARILQTELIRRWGEVQVPGPVGFKAHEFETYLWLQHKSTLADAAVPGGQTIGRYAHPGIWLVASLALLAMGMRLARQSARRSRAEGGR